MLTVIIVLALAVSGYFLYKKYKTSTSSEEILVKEVLKNIDSRPPLPDVPAEPSSSLEEVAVQDPQLTVVGSTEPVIPEEVPAAITEAAAEEGKDMKLLKKKKRRYYTKK